MKASRLIEILNITQKYVSRDDILAEHDIIYFGYMDETIFEKVTEEDKEKLIKLGCDFDESLDCWYVYT